MNFNSQSYLKVPQDLHIHTAFSSSDSSIVPEQTVDLIAGLKHAEIIGISDHLECLSRDNTIEEYIKSVLSHDFYLGLEVNSSEWINTALDINTDYYVYHCYDKDEDYQGIERLLASGKPLIIAHPYFLDTNLDRIPKECYIEINNRYIWKYDWKNYFKGLKDEFNFIISSDAHQPNWLNQNFARYVANEFNIKESLLFKNKKDANSKTVKAGLIPLLQ